MYNKGVVERREAGESPDLRFGRVGTSKPRDESEFASALEPHRRELRVHCYQMLGSFTEAEDLVQETFLRAWRGRSTFEGRSTLRAWLYRIATNVCLDHLRGREGRVLPYDLAAPSDPAQPQPVRTDVGWLQPLPDAACDVEEAVVARETLELAFVVALQHLRPMPRAVLILRDVLGWQAKQVAAQLEVSIPSVNSTLNRARTTLRQQLPEQRSDWTAAALSQPERRLLRKYMDAVERSDVHAMADLLTADVRSAMPPWPMWFAGRDAVLHAMSMSWDEHSQAYVGRFRMLPTGANGQPAAAAYLCRPGAREYEPFAISLLRTRQGRIAELTAFHDVSIFPAFGLPTALAVAS